MKNASLRVAQFRSALSPHDLKTVDALRFVITEAAPSVVEDFKWNAPSFTLEGKHRVTLGLERRGGVRIVLHRGAEKRDILDFAFDDPGGVAAWPDKDRGVAIFSDAASVDAKHAALVDLVARWVSVE